MTGVRFVILVGLCLIQAVVGYNNGMGRLPPMGVRHQSRMCPM